MSMVHSFDEALKRASDGSKTLHLLIGNGFSMACRPTSFSYKELLKEADFSGLSIDVRTLFDAFGTANFEQIVKVLQAAARLIRLYGPGSLADRIEADASKLKDALAAVLAKTHPDLPASISEAEYRSVREFLGHFKAIYSLNYDLLLYWALMQAELNPSSRCDDGFRNPDEEDTEYVVWQASGDYNSQNVFYLHGALHLFDAGYELRKVTWLRTGIRLIDQIRAALDEDVYPLVVTEGTSHEKLTKIMHSNYLGRAFRSFGALQQGTTLFVYGWSLAENDRHIADLIAKAKLGGLSVGLYGDPTTAENQRIIDQASALAADRPKSRPLRVEFYNSATARVWNS